MTLIDLILDKQTRIDAIAEHLDRLTHNERMNELMKLDRAEQRSLYEKAGGSPPITLEHFVPADRAALEPVHHFGRNTLPLPASHRLFQKRFCRPSDGSTRLFGYNEAASRRLVGPGYFVAVPTDGHARWEGRGPIVIDYFQVPDGAVAPGWPTVRQNSVGIQRFVYYETRDFMRLVSKHVSIGAAYKVDKPLDHYFVLCRAD